MHNQGSGIHNEMGSMDGNYGNYIENDSKRSYRKQKFWSMVLKISIETPELDHRLNEQFEIEIGSNQRLKILQQTIMSQVRNPELRELIKNEKMYIYIEGKEPVARKSKSLAEMGVKDGDNLIVTSEMKLPLHELSEDEDLDPVGMFPNPSMIEGMDFEGENQNETQMQGNLPMMMGLPKHD